MSSRLTVAAAAVALAGLAAAPSAHAISPTVVPAPSSTVTYPGSTAPASAWKLVNRGQDSIDAEGVRHHASAVLIAPRWVLSTEHGPMQLGATYTTPYGSSTVQQVIERPCGGCSGAQFDLELYLLSTPINAGTFPKILGERIPAELLPSLPGVNLYAGLGGVPHGQTGSSIGWLRPDARSAGAGTATPDLITGDSGGGAYWYPAPGAAPVLTAILWRGGLPRPNEQQHLASNVVDEWTEPSPGTDVRAWLESSFASVPGAAAPQFTTVAQAAGPRSGFVPAPPSASLAQNGTTTAKIALEPGRENGVPRTGFRIYVNGTLKATAPANATSYTLTGLSRWTKYTVRVAAVNANGESTALTAPNVAPPVFTFTTRLLW